jgi:hypothetical protein
MQILQQSGYNRALMRHYLVYGSQRYVQVLAEEVQSAVLFLEAVPHAIRAKLLQD